LEIGDWILVWLKPRLIVSKTIAGGARSALEAEISASRNGSDFIADTKGIEIIHTDRTSRTDEIAPLSRATNSKNRCHLRRLSYHHQRERDNRRDD
jgi:hypothetical protein